MSEFVDYLQEVFVSFGQIHPRKMFSGYGLYYDGVMFGLVADEVLYLKADASIAHHFEERGLVQFSYQRKDKQGNESKLVKLSYYQAPADIYEDSAEAARWAKKSFEVAFRNQRKKQRNQ